MSTPRADVAHLLRRAGFEASPTEITTYAAMDLPAIVDSILDFSSNPADTPPTSLSDPDKGDWERMVDLTQWWLDRMATVPRPLQEKLTLFWHGHFCTQVSKVGSAVDMFDQNHLFRTEGLGSFEQLVQHMSLQVAMLIYLDNDPNSKGSPNENFARELMELFTLGVNQYTQPDVVASARAWTGHNVDYDATPRVYRFYPERHDTGLKTFMGETRNWDGPEIITRILTVEPQRSIAARFIAKKVWTFFAAPNPSTSILDALTNAFVGSNLDIGTLLRTMFLMPEFYTPTVRHALVRTPVEWIVTVLKATGQTAVDRNPQWWMEQMGQVLFEPPNVAGWKNNAYWLNSTAVWARADFARNLTWHAHDAGFLMETIQRNPANQSQYVMGDAAAVDYAFARFGRDPTVEAGSLWVRSVMVNWLHTQRATEAAPTYSWRDWAAINLTTMTMLSPDVLLA
ncbi:MAG: DUF1800 domain-containing protein [Acidimicrobiia bacterium]